MNVKVTIGAVVVLLAGMGALILVGDAPVENNGPQGVWPEFADQDVSAISWSSSSGPVRVRRVPDTTAEWEVDAGGAWVPAEADRVEEILNEIGRTELLRREPGDTVDATLREEWGLTRKGQSLEFTLRGEVVKLMFGKAALGRDAIYAVRDDSDDVFVISDDIQETLLDAPLNELRRRKIFRWRVAEVERIEVKRGEETTFVAARREDNRFFWWAEVPYTGFVSDLLERDLLPAVLRLEATEFVADDADVVKLGECGLVEPAWRVTVTRARGEGESETVEVGAPVPDREGLVYFRLAGRPFVYAGKSKLLLRQLSKDPGILRDMNLTRLGWEPLGRVRGEIDGTSFVLNREGDLWMIAEPEGMSADALAVEDWFTAVRKFEVREFVDDPEADLNEMGLEEPTGRLTMWMPAPEGQNLGEVAVSLHIGKRTAGGVYARRTGRDEAVFVADEALLGLLAPGAWQFRARQVYPIRPRDEAPARVLRTGVLGDDRTEFVDGAWSNGAELSRVTGLIDHVFALSAMRWVGPAADVDAFGLAETASGSLTVSFGTGESARNFGVILGSETEGGRYARAVRDGKAGEAVFVVSDSAVKLLAGPLK